MLSIVMYHYVRNTAGSKYPGIHALQADEFRTQIEWFKNNGYEFISAYEFTSSLNETHQINGKKVLLTFDDGYIDHYETVFPIMKKNNITGIFAVPAKVIAERKLLDVNKIHFLLAKTDDRIIMKELLAILSSYSDKNTAINADSLVQKYCVKGKYDTKETVFIKKCLQYVLPFDIRTQITNELFKKYVTDDEVSFANELYMNRKQMLEMAQNGNVFALHGYDHFHFDALSENEYTEDIMHALDALSFIIDRNKWIFCYPYGGYSDELIRYCRSVGCIGGLTVESREMDPSAFDPYTIPRFDCNDFPPKKQRGDL